MDKVDNYHWNAVLRYPQSYSQGVDNYVTLLAKDAIRGVYGSG